MNTYSRFAVLAPEIDLDAAHKIKSGPKRDKIKKENKQKENENVKAKTSNQTNNTVIKKKKKDVADLQAMAFGYGKQKGNNKKKVVANGNNKVVANGNNKEKDTSNNKVKKGKPSSANSNHDDDWKKRDEEFVKAQNENSLREAILQSKLEYEQQKKEEKLNEKNSAKSESSQLTKGSSKSRKKKEKPLTLSLSQFNSLELKDLGTLKPSNKNGREPEKAKENGPEVVQDEKFFKDVDETTRKTLEMEHRHEQYKELRNKTRSMNYETQVKKLTAEIEKSDFEIQALRLEVDSLKNQLQAVKSRNKKLCEVISFSEMRSKGELVVELEKVTKGRDEFSEEIARLTAELEQERTRVSHLNNELKKIQGKKRTADSSSK